MEVLEASGGVKDVEEVLGELPSTDDLEDPPLPQELKPFENYYQGGSVEVERYDIAWDALIGLHKIKDKMKERLVLPLKFPHLFTGQRKNQRNMLLFGPPGCGKTMLMRAVAKEADTPLITVNTYSILSKMVTNKALFIKSLFDCAVDNQPCILLIEDIENLSQPEYAEVRQELFNQILARYSTSKFEVVGMTRYPWLLDPKLRRMFEWHLFVPLPDQLTRRAFIKSSLNLDSSVTEENIDDLAKRTEGYTTSDILVLLRDAAMEPVRGLQKATHFKLERHQSVDKPDEMVDLETPCSPTDPKAREKSLMDIKPDSLYIKPVSMEDIEKALKQCKPSVNTEEVVQHRTFVEDFCSPD